MKQTIEQYWRLLRQRQRNSSQSQLQSGQTSDVYAPFFLVSGNVDMDGSPTLIPEGMRAVVEHPVLFKMPRLNADKEQEKNILDSLHALKSKFPDLLTLSTGRLLKEEDGCTHAIFVRFPSQKALTDYYLSEQLMDVIQKMLHSLCGEYTVDYHAFTKDDPVSFSHLAEEYKGAAVHISFFKVKDGANNEAVKEVITSLYRLPEEMPSIVLQITAGANNYLRDKVFSHAFVAHLASESAVKEFHAHPSYLTILEKHLQPICSKILSADFVPYSSE